MEHSPGWVNRAVTVALDVTARLALPGAVLALLHGASDYAVAASLVATASSLLRAFVVGAGLQRELVDLWRRAVAAAKARSLESLLHRREQDESVSMMIEAIYDTAGFRATTIPLIVAQAIALAVLTVVTVALVGAGWILVGVVAGAIVAGLILVAHRRLRAAQERAWSGFARLSQDVRVLVEATAELRANAREEAMAERVVSAATTMAKGQRETATYSAMVSLLPAGLAVLGLAIPLQSGAAWLSTMLRIDRMADVLLLGAASAAVALSLAQNLEAFATGAPRRRVLRELLAHGRNGEGEGGKHLVHASLAECPIRFDDVSVVYPGSERRTPSAVRYDWQPRRGLGVVGLNGSGKSTLALCLLGFLEPTEGRIVVGEAEVVALDLVAYRARLAFAPQDPFLALGESVRWHLELLLGDAEPRARIEGALETVGLLPILERHARRMDGSALDVPLTELSGGERKRLVLARVLLQPAELVVLDEPEAGMDAEGRRIVKSVLAELAKTRRVLAVVHDRAVLPEGFDTVECRSEQLCDASADSSTLEAGRFGGKRAALGPAG